MTHKITQTKKQLKHSNIKIALLVTLTFCLSTAMAQESLNVAGGNASGSGGSVSYSVGQLFYTTNIGTNGSAAQGVQQAYEISVVTAFQHSVGINLSVMAYPNPTSDNLILEVSDFQRALFTFYLYDLNGKLLQSEKITGNQTSIVMNNLVPAPYFVKVTRDNKELKTFKVIKK